MGQVAVYKSKTPKYRLTPWTVACPPTDQHKSWLFVRYASWKEAVDVALEHISTNHKKVVK